jgi:hypothetical protein
MPMSVRSSKTRIPASVLFPIAETFYRSRFRPE